jgi:hypothetical protein
VQNQKEPQMNSTVLEIIKVLPDWIKAISVLIATILAIKKYWDNSKAKKFSEYNNRCNEIFAKAALAEWRLNPSIAYEALANKHDAGDLKLAVMDYLNLCGEERGAKGWIGRALWNKLEGNIKTTLNTPLFQAVLNDKQNEYAELTNYIDKTPRLPQ